MPKSTNREKALNALLKTTSISEAARESGLSEKTLSRYLDDEEFQKEYRKTRRSLVEHSIGQIQSATAEAVETLRKNLKCGVPSAEIRAAQIILETAHKGVELMDILEKLKELEEINNEHQKQIEQLGK